MAEQTIGTSANLLSFSPDGLGSYQNRRLPCSSTEKRYWSQRRSY